MENSNKNYAPKELVGVYNLIIGGKEVRLVNKNDPTKCATVRCHPDDKFDIGEAVKLAMNRVNMDNILRVGDTVQIVYAGQSYPSFKDWPREYFNHAIRYRYGVVPKSGTIGKVVGKLKHDMYVVEVETEKHLNTDRYNNVDCCECVYLMASGGLKKIKDGRYE